MGATLRKPRAGTELRAEVSDGALQRRAKPLTMFTSMADIFSID